LSASVPAVTSNPLALLWQDVRDERRADGEYPVGEKTFSIARTRHFEHDPLGLLLESYERYGPIFTLKIFHHNAVFMLGRRRTTTCSSRMRRTSSGVRGTCVT